MPHGGTQKEPRRRDGAGARSLPGRAVIGRGAYLAGAPPFRVRGDPSAYGIKLTRLLTVTTLRSTFDVMHLRRKSMPDPTASARVRRQRELRIAEGWQEVKVWVPTEADAEAVRKLAEERRARAEDLHGLQQEALNMTMETRLRIEQAIRQHGSKAHNTPSGPILELMTAFTREDNIEAFSHAVVILARAKPPNAAFVVSAVPAKINNFLITHRGVNPKKLYDWSQANPDWADELKATVRDTPRFTQLVESMAEIVRDWTPKH